jgi:hypothetical protein
MMMDDMQGIDDGDIVSIQLAANQAVYTAVIDIYDQIKESIASGDAAGVLVSSIATSLGMVIGQIPDAHRESYLQVAKVILEKSFMSTIESIDHSTYGQVGHA